MSTSSHQTELVGYRTTHTLPSERWLKAGAIFPSPHLPSYPFHSSTSIPYNPARVPRGVQCCHFQGHYPGKAVLAALLPPRFLPPRFLKEYLRWWMAQVYGPDAVPVTAGKDSREARPQLVNITTPITSLSDQCSESASGTSAFIKPLSLYIERTGNEEYLYSTVYTMHSLKVLRHGSQFYLQITPCLRIYQPTTHGRPTSCQALPLLLLTVWSCSLMLRCIRAPWRGEKFLKNSYVPVYALSAGKP